MKPTANLVVSLGAAAFLFVGHRAGALSAEERIDVSRIIDKAAAEAVLGETVKAPSPRNMHGGDGYYSKCNYYTANSGKRLIIRVYQAGPGFDVGKDFEAVRASTGAAKPVSGLGDKAQVYSGADSGLPTRVTMLYVVKGSALVTVGVAGVDDDTALDKTKTVAQKILAQL